MGGNTEGEPSELLTSLQIGREKTFYFFSFSGDSISLILTESGITRKEEKRKGIGIWACETRHLVLGRKPQAVFLS